MSNPDALASGIVGQVNDDDLFVPGRARPHIVKRDLEEVKYQSLNTICNSFNSSPQPDFEANAAPTRRYERTMSYLGRAKLHSSS